MRWARLGLLLAACGLLAGGYAFVVYEMDVQAAYADWQSRSRPILALLGVLAIAMAVAGFLAWQGRARARLRTLYRAGARRRAAAERSEIVLRSIGDAVVVTDERGDVELLNDAAERLTGWSDAEARGLPAREVLRFVSEATGEDLAHPVERALREDRVASLDPHALLIARDGTERPVADTGAPVRDETGTLTGIVLVLQDETAQRQRERSLAASERRHRALIEGAPQAIFIEADGRFVYANAACLRLLEARHPADVIGHPVLDRFHPAHHDTVRERMRRLNGRGEPVGRVEEEIVSLEGRVIPVEVSAVPFSTDGRPGVLVFMQDIHARKDAEEALAKQYVMFARTERLAGIGSWEWDIARDEVSWSEELFRIFGLPPAEQAPSFAEHSQRFVAEDFERLRKAIDECITSGTPYELELRAIRSDGAIRHCVVQGLPDQEADGRIRRLVGTFQDVTERRRMEERERRLIAAVEQAVEGIVITDPRGVIEYVNPAFERITGYRRAEAVGQHIRLLKSGEQDRAFYETLWETIRSGRVWTGQMVNRRKDGTLYSEESTISPVFDGAGAIINYVAVKHDVSERKRLEREREQLQRQFHQAQKMEAVGRLAGGVAHDFNNMLSVILGHAELAMSDVPPSDPLHADLAEIARAASRSSEVTGQLLAFARKQTISPRVLDLNEMVETMLRMIRRLIGEDIALAWRPGEGLWPVRMDPGQIDQTLVNLCVNARDAIEGVGTVTIQTANVTLDDAYCAERPGFVPGEFVLLAVSDDGAGMDPETRESIFEPFFTTKAVKKGTGLGLATVYGIVKQNRGFINVYSEPGLGTTFRIYLPRHEGDGDVEAVRETAVQWGRGETVLFAEDDAALLALGRRMLESLGYEVLTAATPAEAEALGREHGERIQLLVTDVIMPGMNGRDLAEQMRALCPHIAVLFVSGYPAEVIAHRGILAADVHFLQKPLSLAGLAAKAREALAGRDPAPGGP